MSWRVAESLLQMRDQVNALYPNRSKSDDGTIGDTAHQHRVSDHNPDQHGVVRALDLTHDPAHGFDSYAFADMLRRNGDPRLKYVISNHRIWSPTVSSDWHPYHGADPHTGHVHISVVPSAIADSRAPWKLDGQPTPVPPPAPQASRFHRWLGPLLQHEGGNDDDPVDPGGRTSRGITQSEWNLWRRTHPGLPSDVWQAPNDQVEAIYKQNYWDKVRGDELPTGVDYAVFDYGVNSGIARATTQLQRALGVPVDGIIGPVTLAAARNANPQDLINKYCDNRMAYLRQLPTWWRFGHGWTTRVNDVRRDALAAVQSVPVA